MQFDTQGPSDCNIVVSHIAHIDIRREIALIACRMVDVHRVHDVKSRHLVWRLGRQTSLPHTLAITKGHQLLHGLATTNRL